MFLVVLLSEFSWLKSEAALVKYSSDIKIVQILTTITLSIFDTMV